MQRRSAVSVAEPLPSPGSMLAVCLPRRGVVGARFERGSRLRHCHRRAPATPARVVEPWQNLDGSLTRAWQGAAYGQASSPSLLQGAPHEATSRRCHLVDPRARRRRGGVRRAADDRSGGVCSGNGRGEGRGQAGRASNASTRSHGGLAPPCAAAATSRLAAAAPLQGHSPGASHNCRAERCGRAACTAARRSRRSAGAAGPARDHGTATARDRDRPPPRRGARRPSRGRSRRPEPEHAPLWRSR
jgi:hypothetical protein